MNPVPRKSLVETTAEHLRAGFRSARWRKLLPGVRTLAVELAVSKDTVRAALKLLESEGSLQPQGSGKRRKITSSKTGADRKNQLRVGIFLHTPLAMENSHSQRLLLGLRTALELEGHVCAIVSHSSAANEGGSLRWLSRLVTEAEADAWVVYAGHGNVLEWFAASGIRTFALGGRFQGLPLASSRTDLTNAMSDCVDALVQHGHRRIVLISPEWWRKPGPNVSVEAFLGRLRHHSLSASAYNIPDWEEAPPGLAKLMQALFFATPPTALLLAEPVYTSAAHAWLGEHGYQVPRDVSLVNLLPDPLFAMHTPPYSSFIWPEHTHIRQIQNWLKRLSNGSTAPTTHVCHATFEMGGSIGPAKPA